MKPADHFSHPTWSDLRLGFVHFLPVGVVVFGYAVVFGLLARGSGLSIAEACLMSLTVFAGASQFISLPMIREGASIASLGAMAFVVNLRHLLYGLNIGRKFRGEPAWKLFGVSVGIVDETYAFTTVGPGQRIRSIPYFMGTAICSYLAWNAGTLVGAAAGRWVPSLSAEGLDFAMVAVFIAMVGSSIRKKVEWLAVGLSVIIAAALFRYAGGYWHLFAAGLFAPFAASLTGKDPSLEN
jgi:4-azaleucine resistance transporter AzlC